MATERLDLSTLISTYGSEEAARTLLEKLRWPNGVACTKCGSLRNSRVKGRDTFRCLDCAMHFSVRAGTVLQDSKLPLSKWLLATFLVCEAKKGISSNQLKRMIGTTYKTSWYLTHRIRHAMTRVPQAQLTGIVGADETFVGPKRAKKRTATGQQLRGRIAGDPKTVILGAVERGGEVRLRVGPRRTRETLHGFLADTISEEATHVYTDELQMYTTAGLDDENTRHSSVNHSIEEWVRGDVHTQTIEGVWSLFKRGLIGSHHHMSVKHLPAYLTETAFKYNNRDNEHIFRETLRVLVTADPLTYAALIED